MPISLKLLYIYRDKFTPPLEFSKFLAKKLIVRGKISAYYIICEMERQSTVVIIWGRAINEMSRDGRGVADNSTHRPICLSLVYIGASTTPIKTKIATNFR